MHQAHCEFYEAFFAHLSGLEAPGSGRDSAFELRLQRMAEQRNPLALYFLSLSLHSSVSAALGEHTEGPGSDPAIREQSLEVLDMSLEALQVNPEQTAFFIGDILLRGDLHAELGVDRHRCRLLALEWLVLAASLGNAEAMLALASVSLEELSKVLFQANLGAERLERVLSSLHRKSIEEVYSQGEPGKVGWLGSAGQAEPAQDGTKAFLRLQFESLRRPELSK